MYVSVQFVEAMVTFAALSNNPTRKHRIGPRAVNAFPISVGCCCRSIPAILQRGGGWQGMIAGTADVFVQREVVLCIAAAPCGFWVAVLAHSATRKAFVLSINTPHCGLVTLSGSLLIPCLTDEDTPGKEMTRLVWNPDGTKIAVLVNGLLYICHLSWRDKTTNSPISIQEAAALVCAMDGDGLVGDAVGTSLLVGMSCPQSGSILKMFSSLPSYLFVIDEDKIHQLSWSGDMIKIVVTNNVQDRWLFRLWDRADNRLRLNAISFVDSHSLSTPPGADPAMLIAPSRSDDALEEIDIDAPAVADLIPSKKTRCIADVQCAFDSTLFILFYDGSVSVFVDPALSLPSSPRTLSQFFISPRMHMVCQVAYPVIPISSKALPSGAVLLEEPEVYEMNTRREYASKATTLAEVRELLRVDDNILAQPSFCVTATGNSGESSVSVSLYHKIARSVSLVNGSNKHDIADVVSLHVLPGSPRSSPLVASASAEALVVLRVKHILDDPQYAALLKCDPHASALHNVRAPCGVSYLLCKVEFTTHHVLAPAEKACQGRDLAIECKEASKLFYSRDFSVPVPIVAMVHPGASEAAAAAMVVVVASGTDITLRSLDQLLSVLMRFPLVSSPLLLTVSTNVLMLANHIRPPAGPPVSTEITVLPVQFRDPRCPNVFVDERRGLLALLTHRWSKAGTSPLDPTDPAGTVSLASLQDQISLPRPLHQALLLNKSLHPEPPLTLIIGCSELRPISVLTSYQLRAEHHGGIHIGKYLDQYSVINERVDTNYVAVVKNKLRAGEAQFSTTARYCLAPELWVYSVATRRWKSILLAIGSSRSSGKQSSVKMVKHIPAVSYSSRAAVSSFSEFRNHHVSMWDIDVDSAEADGGGRGGTDFSAAAVVNEDVQRSRSTSSSSIPLGPTVLLGASPRLRMTSSSAPVSAKSHLTQQHLQVLEAKWWGTHTVALLTLRKSQHYLEVVTRDSLPVYHTLPATSSMRHNVSKVHRLVPLPVGFIPKCWAFREVHMICGSQLSSNSSNHLVVVVANDSAAIAYQLSAVTSPALEIKDYNVVELWSASFEEIRVGGEPSSPSLLQQAEAGGGLKRIELLAQQFPLLPCQVPAFEHLERNCSPVRVASGATIFVSFVSVVVTLESDSEVYYVDPVHLLASPLRSLSSQADIVCEFRTAVSDVFALGQQHLPLRGDDADPQTFDVTALWLQVRPLDRVQRYKLQSLLALTKFDLLLKYGKSANHRALAGLRDEVLRAAEGADQLVLFCAGDTEQEHAVSYMPTAGLEDAWLHKHLDPPAGAPSCSVVALMLELGPASVSSHQLGLVGGMRLVVDGARVVAQNLHFLLASRLFDVYGRSIRAVNANGEGCAPGMTSLPWLDSPEDTKQALSKRFFARVLRGGAREGFARKHFVYEAEQLLLRVVMSCGACASHLCEYALMSSFLLAMDADVYIAIIARVLRQAEPSVSRKLFPLTLLPPARVGLYDAPGAPQTLPLLEVYEMALERPLLQCSGQFLSLLCEALGGAESLSTIRTCLVVCIEFVFRALQCEHVDSALQCLDFAERLLTILCASPPAGLEAPDLGDIRAQVGLHLSSIKSSTSSSTGDMISTKAPVEDAGGLLGWLLGRLGVSAPESSSPHASSRTLPLSEDEGGVVTTPSTMHHAGYDVVRRQLGDASFSDLLAPRSALAVADRTALLLGALLADRLRALLGDAWQRGASWTTPSPRPVFVINSSTHAGRLIEPNHRLLDTPQSSPRVESPREGRRLGSALLLMVALLQSPRARSLLRQHLSLTLAPALAERFSASAPHALLPELAEDLPALAPFWHILRLQKFVGAAARGKRRLTPDMGAQEVSLQYVLKLAQLEHHTHSSGAPSRSAPPIYLGVFGAEEELTGRGTSSVCESVRAVATLFMLLDDLHTALSVLFALRDLFAEGVRVQIAALAKALTKLHRRSSAPEDSSHGWETESTRLQAQCQRDAWDLLSLFVLEAP